MIYIQIFIYLPLVAGAIYSLGDVYNDDNLWIYTVVYYPSIIVLILWILGTISFVISLYLGNLSSLDVEKLDLDDEVEKASEIIEC